MTYFNDLFSAEFLTEKYSLFLINIVYGAFFFGNKKTNFFFLHYFRKIIKMSQRKSARQKRRSSDQSMPSGGAGLIRFYQDQSNGIKISAITALVFSVLLIVVVILGHLNIFNWLLGASA